MFMQKNIRLHVDQTAYTLTLTAYGKLQFEEVSEEERVAIRDGLLRYCELDTLAMVMIYECFRELCEL